MSSFIYCLPRTAFTYCYRSFQMVTFVRRLKKLMGFKNVLMITRRTPGWNSYELETEATVHYAKRT